MSIENKAAIKLAIEGTEQALAALRNVNQAGKKCGTDITESFKSAGVAVANFGASVADAVVDVASLDPSTLVKGFEDYARMVTKTSLATGQSITDLRSRYTDLSRINAVMPQQIDSFAKSVGRMTYDIKGAQDAFSGMHDAALAFGETDQEQVPFSIMLKNLGIAAGDTTQAVAKLYGQADKLGTVGGAHALRDLFVELGPVIDSSVSKLADGVKKAQAFAAVLTAGLNKNTASRVASSAIGFLQGQGMAIWKQFGENPYDDQGHIKDPVKWYSRILSHDLKSVENGGRGMTPQMVQMALYQDLGPEAGAAMWRAVNGGLHANVKATMEAAPIFTAQKIGIASRNTQIGKLDSGRFEQFEGLNKYAGALFDAKADLAQWVGNNPILAGVAKEAFNKALPRLIDQAIEHPMAALAVGAAAAVGYVATQTETGQKAASDLLDSLTDMEVGPMPTKKGAGPQPSIGSSPPGGTASGMTAKDLVDELHSRPLPVQTTEKPTTASQAERDKNLGSRN